MPLHFTIDDTLGFLSWDTPGGGKPSLTPEEATIVAAAENAAALRAIAAAIYDLGEAVGGLSSSA